MQSCNYIFEKDVILVAFKVLSPNELDVLSEDERKAYEAEYEDYCDRVAFVERLEQLEKVQMPKVSVKKKGIKRVKGPSVNASHMRGFTVDSTQGAILLSATKKAKAILETNTKPFSITKYRATLPHVGVISPNEVQFEGAEYRISNLQYPQHITLNTSEVKLDNYTVSSLPDINMSMPDVSVASLKSRHIDLESVPISKPTTIDVVIEGYETTFCEKTIAEAPIVEYSTMKVDMTALSEVPIVKPHSINSVVEATKIEVPTPVVINSPKVSVEVSPQHISPLDSVVIPVVAPSISVAMTVKIR